MSVKLICPICSTELSLKDKFYICSNNHNFDLAKEGYLNLLLINQKKTKEAGDNQEMVSARSNFLEQGFYSPLSDRLNKEICLVLNNKKVTDILDSGCGEGYYLFQLNNYLKEKSILTNSYGLDLSKYAIKTASKKAKNIQFTVSNISHKLPFADSSFDIILSIFAPKNPPEFKRVLKSKGILIIVFPNSDHLKELRSAIGLNINYKEKPEEVISLFKNEFGLIKKDQLNYSLRLSKDNALLLTKMTPMYWQIDHNHLSHLNEIITNIGFNIFIFQRLT